MATQATLESKQMDRILRAYKENPKSINTPIKDGNYPLTLAVEKGTPKIVKLLLDLGANPNVYPEDPDNAYTPLILAVSDNKTEMVSLLIEHGADVNMGNPYTNEKPIGDAIMNICYGEIQHYEIFNILMSNHPDPNVHIGEKSGLYLAVEKGKMELANRLLKAGASVDYGFPLHTAVQEKSVHILKTFLKWGANPNLKQNGKTPLHIAVEEGQEDMIDELLDADADPYIPNNMGKTAMNYAGTNRIKKSLEPENVHTINLHKPNWFANLGIAYSPGNNERYAAAWYKERGIAHGGRKTRKGNDKRLKKKKTKSAKMSQRHKN